MVKKVKSQDLKQGMYIHDLNAAWLNHPFMSSSLKLESEKMIEKIIKHGIKEVYIDTEKGIDI